MDNNHALGYMLVACRQLGYTKEQVRALYLEMCYQFDVKTEQEAEKIGLDWYYSLED